MAARSAARESLSLSLRYTGGTALAERSLGQLAATSFFTRPSLLPVRRGFHQGRILRQVGSELESDIATDEVTEVEEEGTEAEEDELEAKAEEESEEEEEDDEDEEDSDSSSSDEDFVEVPWNDYSELDGAYSTSSFDGISTRPFAPEIKDKLLGKVDPQMVEIKPDGHLYLPEIQYRRILNNSFGPGGWAMMPRTPLEYDANTHVCSREYALYAFGRFISQAGGEQPVSETVSPTTASEAAKSQALMRCCKDLGVASELWEPTFIREWKKVYAVQEWYEHVKTGKKTLLWRRRDRVLGYPYKESPPVSATPTQASTRSTSYAQQSQSSYGQQQGSYGQQQQASYGQQPAYTQQAPPQPAYSQPQQAPRQARSTAQAQPPPPPPPQRAAPAPPMQPPGGVPPASRPTLYTPYKSYATRASTNPMGATRPVHAPKPVPGSAAAAGSLGGLGGEGDEAF